MLEQTNNLVRQIVIIGGGTAGWMTAAALAHAFGGIGVSITLVESESIGTVGVGEATLPQIRTFNQSLGIDESEMMAATAATIKLGIEFRDWGRMGDHYIHPFGVHGEQIGPADFHHYWLRMERAGLARDFGKYCYPIEAARAGRFAPPADGEQSSYPAFAYAFQFDASLYGAFLSKYAQNKGVRRQEGKVVSVSSNSETGFIEAVELESGASIEAELFIDCSGFRGLLIERELETGYNDWTEYLPCNRAIAVPCETGEEVGPYTRATARSAGWQWRIPLQHRVGNGLVYCDQYISDQDAEDQLISSLEGRPIADPNRLFFKTGKRCKLWNKNCVAIGLAGGFLEPLESTSIDLIQSGITNLIALFPERYCDQRDVNEYNRLMDLEFERIRDFLMLHYVANQRDEPFWRDLCEMTVPDSLRDKMEAFEKRGLVPEYAGGLFQPPSWLSVFTGQNIRVEQYDPRADLMDEAELKGHLERIEKSVADNVADTPKHLDFLQSSGAAFEAEALSQS